MSFARHALPLLLLTTIAAVACTVQENNTAAMPECPMPDSGTPVPTPDGGVDLGECVTYTPANIASTKSGTFTSSDDRPSITLPTTDVGGGLLEVTLTSQSQPFEVALWLGVGEKKDEARAEGEVGESTTTKFTLRLLGNQTYELRATPLDFRDDRPNGYTFSWTYTPLVDCYEANDTRETAKRIPLNTPIKAFLNAGVGPDESRIVGPSADDWYWFELTEAKEVTLRANVPGDNTAYFTLLRADDSNPACNDPNFGIGTSATDTAEEMISCTGPLEPGKYWVKGAISNSEYPSTGPGEEVPTSWNTAYTLTIDAK